MGDPKKPVTKDDVIIARNKLRSDANGGSVTVREIRAITGGSLTTITAHLRQIAADEATTHLSESAQAVWERLFRVACDQVGGLQKQQIATLEGLLNDAERENAGLEERVHTLTTQLEAAEKQSREAATALAAANLENRTAQSSVVSADERAAKALAEAAESARRASGAQGDADRLTRDVVALTHQLSAATEEANRRVQSERDAASVLRTQESALAKQREEMLMAQLASEREQRIREQRILTDQLLAAQARVSFLEDRIVAIENAGAAERTSHSAQISALLTRIHPPAPPIPPTSTPAAATPPT